MWGNNPFQNFTNGNFIRCGINGYPIYFTTESKPEWLKYMHYMYIHTNNQYMQRFSLEFYCLSGTYCLTVFGFRRLEIPR